MAAYSEGVAALLLLLLLQHVSYLGIKEHEHFFFFAENSTAWTTSSSHPASPSLQGIFFFSSSLGCY